MLVLLRVIFYSLGIPILIITTVITLSTTNTSQMIPAKWTLSQLDIQHAKSILQASQRGRGPFVNLELTERDLNIAAAYALNLYTNSRSYIQIKKDHILVNLLFILPRNLFGHYMPVQFLLYFSAGKLSKIKHLQVGKIIVSDLYASLLVENIIKYTRLNQYLALIKKNIKQVELQVDTLLVTYLRPNSQRVSGDAQSLLAPESEKQALFQYQEKLTEALSHHQWGQLLSLSDVLRPLFQLAQQRSTIENVIAENQLAIFVANRYVNRFPGVARQRLNGTFLRKHPVYLYRRTDMAKHFMWSATLSTLGGSQLADMIGVEKELSDAKSGSGFSFIDLAADRAGVTFGESMTSNPEQAMRLQKKLAIVKNYQDFMPNVKDLPERLSVKAFKTQYQSVYSPKYQLLLQDIDQRIDASALYH